MSDRPQWHREGRGWPNATASRFVTAGGLDWHVQVAGVGPTLLFLHGTGAATHSARALLPLLARNFTVVVPDLPGHGFTAQLARPGLPRVAGAVAALMDALERTPVLIVGHSAGAAIALRMALDGLAPPAPIVSLAGALLPFPGPAARLFPALARLLFDNSLAPQLAAAQARLPGMVGRFLERSTGSRIDAEGVELYGRLFRTPGHCAGALQLMAAWDLEALAADLPRLTAPLTLVTAERDAAVPAWVAREVGRKVARARVVAMAGVGHLLHEERPAEVAALIEATWAQAEVTA